MNVRNKIARKWRIFIESGGSLLESRHTKIVHIEFTSRCNLKCIYCPVSQPEYKASDMEPDRLVRITNVLKTRHCRIIVVSGHGETTIYPRWTQYCDDMLDAGMSLHIISNFSKKLSNNEIRTLARFESVEISCDSHDPEVFRSLRRGADLQIICTNVRQLEAASDYRGRMAPLISFSCVISDRNVLQLPEYVAFGKNLGINRFAFCNLTKYADVDDVINAKHITEMEPQLFPRIKKSLDDTFQFLKKSHIEFSVQQGLIDSFVEKMHSVTAGHSALPIASLLNSSQVDSVAIGTNRVNALPSKSESVPSLYEKRYSSLRPGDMTRDCLDPWSFILFHANGQVRPCCWQNPIMMLGKHQSAAIVFNSLPIQKLRRQLLNGDLQEKCLYCPSRSWTTRVAFLKKVKKHLYPGRYWLSFFAAKIPELPMSEISDIEFGKGWYPEEQDYKISDPEQRSWRWISQKAICLVRNPKHQSRLVIRGHVHPIVIAEQKLSVYIGETLMDEFSLHVSQFYIEYEFPSERWGEEETVPIILEARRTFVPSQCIPGSNDNRELGIQIHHCEIRSKV